MKKLFPKKQFLLLILSAFLLVQACISYGAIEYRKQPEDKWISIKINESGAITELPKAFAYRVVHGDREVVFDYLRGISRSHTYITVHHPVTREHKYSINTPPNYKELLPELESHLQHLGSTHDIVKWLGTKNLNPKIYEPIPKKNSQSGDASQTHQTDQPNVSNADRRTKTTQEVVREQWNRFTQAERTQTTYKLFNNAVKKFMSDRIVYNTHDWTPMDQRDLTRAINDAGGLEKFTTKQNSMEISPPTGFKDMSRTELSATPLTAVTSRQATRMSFESPITEIEIHQAENVKHTPPNKILPKTPEPMQLPPAPPPPLQTNADAPQTTQALRQQQSTLSEWIGNGAEVNENGRYPHLHTAPATAHPHINQSTVPKQSSKQQALNFWLEKEKQVNPPKSRIPAPVSAGRDTSRPVATGRVKTEGVDIIVPHPKSHAQGAGLHRQPQQHPQAASRARAATNRNHPPTYQTRRTQVPYINELTRAVGDNKKPPILEDEIK